MRNFRWPNETLAEQANPGYLREARLSLICRRSVLKMKYILIACCLLVGCSKHSQKMDTVVSSGTRTSC